MSQYRTYASHSRGLAILVVGMMAWAPAASGVDFLVSSTLDQPDVSPGDGICDADSTSAVVCTLRAAVQEANALPNASANDRIGILGGVYTLTIAGRDEDAAATGDLDITETVEILGDPNNIPTLDGGTLDRVFDLCASSSSGLLLRDMVIRNGSAVRAVVSDVSAPPRA